MTSAPDETPWVRRPYDANEDEDALVALWLMSYMTGSEGVRRGAHRSGMRGDAERSDEEVRAARREMWAEQAPLVEVLLASTDVEVICDPDRVTTGPLGPAVIWAFAATSGDVVHSLVVKRSVAREIGADLVRALLGDRLERPCAFTAELPEMTSGRCGVRLPSRWHLDPLWLPRRLVGMRRVAGAKDCVRFGPSGPGKAA